MHWGEERGLRLPGIIRINRSIPIQLGRILDKKKKTLESKAIVIFTYCLVFISHRDGDEITLPRALDIML